MQPSPKDSVLLVVLTFLFCRVNYLKGSWPLFSDLDRPVGNFILMSQKEQNLTRNMLEYHNQTDASGQIILLVLLLWDYWIEHRAVWHTVHNSFAPSMCIMTCSITSIARRNQCVICSKWYCVALKDFFRINEITKHFFQRGLSSLNRQIQAVYYQKCLSCQSEKNQGIKAWWASPSDSSCVNLVNHLPTSTG